MKGRGLWAAAACLFAIAILVGGCGSSDSSIEKTNAAATETSASEDASTGPLTKKEFVDQADEICHAGLKKKDDNVTAALETLPSNSSTQAGKKAAGKVVELAVLPVYTEIIEQFDQLNPPKGDEAAADLIVQKYEAAMERAEDDPASAIEANPFQAGDRAAEAYGITDCIL